MKEWGYKNKLTLHRGDLITVSVVLIFWWSKWYFGKNAF